MKAQAVLEEVERPSHLASVARPTVLPEPAKADLLLESERPLRPILLEVQAGARSLRAIVNDARVPVIVFDAHRRMLDANAAAEKLFGYGHGELNGRPTEVLIPARLRQPDAPPMPEASDVVLIELPGLMADGTERPLEWRFASVRTAGEGQSSGRLVFIMTVRDRLELDRATGRLRDSEERFQLFVNGVRDCAIYMLDPEGRVSSWNAGATRVKGWEADDILGRPYDVFFTDEDRALGRPAELLADAVAQGSVENTGWRVRKDGSRFWVEGSLTALRDADGRVRGFAKITRDLTERLRAEESERRLIAERAAREAAQEAERRVRESEERLSRLQRMTAALSESATPEEVAAAILRECLEATGAGGSAVYLLSADGQTLELAGQRGHPDESAEAYRLLPLGAQMPITDAARSRTPAFYEDFEDAARAYPAIRTAIAVGNFQATAALPLVAHGDLLGVLGIRFHEARAFQPSDRTLLLTLSDLCAQALDRARLFAAERHARATAESASRAKDEFLAMLGHELRNPLAPIATAVELMKLRGDDRTRQERDVIQRQVTHLNRLVDDLLDVSRVARGLVSLSRKPTQVSEILSKAIEMASPLIEQRRQQLVVSAPERGLSIDADPLRMAQVVSNLLTNAAKYTAPGGHIWLSAEHERGRAVIRVRDDGEGIGPDLLPRVFDLFVQGKRTIARSEGGLGLGLALVKSLVTLHGGTVTATSEGPGRGSEFVVRLPALDPAAAQGQGQGQADDSTPPLAVVEPSPTAPGKRILVVDDNEDARELMGEMLRTFGHEVELAHDGPSALGKLRTFRADVAILDLGLPVMDGFELARRIAETRQGRRPRLIALTGYGRERDVAQTRAAGFDVHLVKPVDVPVLVSAIEAQTAAEPSG